MSVLSVRLDDNVRRELEVQARERGIGLGTLLRELAEQRAREGRRRRIYEASERVGKLVRESAEAREFYEGGGLPVIDAD